MTQQPASVGVPFLGALAQSVAGKISVMVFGFGTLMVVARNLPPEQIGVFLLMQAAAFFLMEVSSFGVQPALARSLAAEDDAAVANRLAGSALSFRLITLTVAAAVAWVSAESLASLFDLTVSPDLWLYMPLLVIAEGLFKFFVAVLQGRYQFRRAAWANVISSASNAAITLTLLLTLDWGIEALFLGKILARTLAIIYCVVVTRVRPGLPTRARLEALLRFGSVLQANYILSFVYQRIDTFLIAAFIGPAELALYEIVRRLPDVLIDLHEAFVVVFFPFVSGLSSSGDTPRIEHLVNTANRWTGLAGGIGTLGAFLFGKAILTVLFSARYAEGWAVFGLLILAVTMVAYDSNLGYVLVGVGDAARSLVVSIVRTVAGVTLYLLLLPAFGLSGAAATNSLSLAVIIPLLLRFLRRRGIHPEMKSIIGPLAVVGLFLAGWELFSLDAVWQRAALLLVYPLVCARAGFISSSDVHEVIDRVPNLVRARQQRRGAGPDVTVDSSASTRFEKGISKR